MLMGRRLRSILPTTDIQLKPSYHTPKLNKNKILESKNKQKRYFDKGSHPLKDLNVGETVRIKRDYKWKPALVVKQNDARSYTVATPDGGIYRRNRRHLLKTNETSIDNFDLDTHQNPNTKFQDINRKQLDQSNNMYKQKSTPVTNSSQNSQHEAKPIRSSNVDNNNVHQSDDSTYVTRSGRVVIPKTIQSM